LHESLTRLLVCPSCHGALRWKIVRRNASEIEEANAQCSSCDSHYQVYRGIGAFLTSQEKPKDLWEETNSQIEELVRREPAKVRLLLETPMTTMNPTDLFFRGLILDSRGKYEEGKVARDRAVEGSYSLEQRACIQSQMTFVKGRIVNSPSPVVDLASGMGALLEVLLPGASQHFVATDASPRVLIRDQAVLGSRAGRAGLSFLAFDARRTPFADRSVRALVSYLGLANIEDPGNLVKELRRIVSGTVLAISLFYPEEVGPNTDMIRRLRLEPLLYRKSAVKQFKAAGFKVRVENMQKVLARPTPEGEILKSAQTDRLPVIETQVEWCTLVAS
jgi:ubiquinone/menaquinone biosynthesis C-methylase UbiE/uncharacterized protein YbaR (Trm112 family)